MKSVISCKKCENCLKNQARDDTVVQQLLWLQACSRPKLRAPFPRSDRNPANQVPRMLSTYFFTRQRFFKDIFLRKNKDTFRALKIHECGENNFRNTCYFRTCHVFIQNLRRHIIF